MCAAFQYLNAFACLPDKPQQCMHLHAFACLHQNETDNFALNKRYFPFVETHYARTLSLLYLTLAWERRHSQGIPPQSYRWSRAINMHSYFL